MSTRRESETSPERVAAERAVLSRRVQRMSGELTTAATSRMDEALPWFKALPANERSSVSTIAGAGIATFVDWFTSDQAPSEAVGAIFSSAPRFFMNCVLVALWAMLFDLKTIRIISTILA